MDLADRVALLEARLAILDAIGQYTQREDAMDADAFAALFSEDGVFEIRTRIADDEPRAFHGRDAIRDWALRRYTSGPLFVDHQARHLQTGTVFDELTPDAARTRTTLMNFRLGPHDERPYVSGGGVYHDRWVRTPDGWRLAERSLHLDRHQPERPRPTGTLSP